MASEDLNKNMAGLEKQVKTLRQNVDNVSKLAARDPDDRFEEVMSVFLELGESELKLCQTLKTSLDQEYAALAKYLCFDAKKSPIES